MIKAFVTTAANYCSIGVKGRHINLIFEPFSVAVLSKQFFRTQLSVIRTAINLVFRAIVIGNYFSNYDALIRSQGRFQAIGPCYAH